MVEKITASAHIAVATSALIAAGIGIRGTAAAGADWTVGDSKVGGMIKMVLALNRVWTGIR